MAFYKVLLGSLDFFFILEKSKYILQQDNLYRKYLLETSKLLVGCIRLKRNKSLGLFPSVLHLMLWYSM